jgi:hypothetical protein
MMMIFIPIFFSLFGLGDMQEFTTDFFDLFSLLRNTEKLFFAGHQVIRE